MFSKILIANRGEIAVRIIRACKEMGITSVAVYSEADRDALHRALADESYCIGPASAQESYLSAEKLISAALVSGAQAIHPGYGFLSESAEFAKLCRKNGIVFIGPEPSLMETIGDKTKVKSLFKNAGLPVIPGTEALPSAEEAVKAAEEIGYPVMLKAVSGGGGRGIRVISSNEELKNEYPLAVSEAEKAFGDGSVYIEKYVYPARHVEVQILADEYGNVVSLGERDCSIQRKHQKLIEESPCPGVKPEEREKLLASARKAVAAIDYTGVGTLEFLLDRQGNFWFMEMNVRLQVEHCVTEMLTGIDLVKWQIRTATGVPIDFRQDKIRMKGAAIECRINALSSGRLESLHVPGGHQVRFDSWLAPGTKVSPFYDPLLGKLIVYAAVRDEAVRKMKAALCELIIAGIPTNIEEQLNIVSSPEFSSGNYDLTTMEGR